MVTLRARGASRFFAAGFLGIWLSGWAAGEGFALWLLANGVCALMAGTALGSGPIRLKEGPAIAIGGFLLLWLAIWTVGGMAALTEFFRLLWGEDRIGAEGGGLSVVHVRGPFRSRRELPRDAVRRFVLTGRGALAVETPSETVELSRLGSFDEREAAVKTLRTELGLKEPDAASIPVTLPRGWEEIITPEGERAVVPDHEIRRIKAKIAGIAAFGLATAAVFAVRESLGREALWPFAVQLALGTFALAAASVWLARGRMEWRIGSGRLTLRRRFGPGVRDVFEAHGFELTLAQDRSDHYDWFALDALTDPPGTTAGPAPLVTVMGKKRRRITSVVRDAGVPRQLGLYLAKAGDIPFVDRTTPEACAAELTLLKAQLEKAGPLGRLAIRLVVNTKERKQA